MMGFALLILILAGIVLLVFLGRRPAAPTDYQQKAKTSGDIEKKYMENGPYAVSLREEKVLQGFEKYIIYYPTALETSHKPYPVIVLSNGSGTPLSKYPAVAKHYASWGFIVIGAQEQNDWNGFAAEMCVRHLKRWNDNEMVGDTKSIFYQKVDLENVGIVGHSQGGVGVFNAMTAQPHKDVFQTGVALSPTNKELADHLEWEYDAAQIHVPVLLISGAGGGDDWVVTGDQLREIYEDIPSDKVMVRRKDTPHSQVLYMPNGYVAAWLLWQLQGDEEAAKAFIGNAPEIENNPLYQDFARCIG